MRILVKTMLVFSAMALVASQTSAQDTKGKTPRGGGFANAARLVTNESVQKEIKVTEEQTEKVKKAATEVLEKFTDDFKKLGKDASPEDRAELNKKVSDAAYKSLSDILKDDQVKRLKQIEIQQQGLTNAETQKTLKLSDEQKEKIKKEATDAREKARDVFKDAGGDFKAAMEKISTINKESREKQVGVLTDDQKKQWKELTGEPFEVKFEPRVPKDKN